MTPAKLKYLPNLPDAPYFVVIFSSRSTHIDAAYNEVAMRMLKLAQKQAGFLGVSSVRENQTGITVSYWKDEKSIQRWQQHTEHLQAQKLGKIRWYDEYSIQVAKVERSYSGTKKD